MMAFAFGLVVGGVLGVFSTVVLGIMIHQRQQDEKEVRPDLEPDPTLVVLRDSLLRHRELVDDDGNLRRH